MKESDLQAQCNAYLRVRGICFYHQQKGRTNGQKFTSMSGLPDLLMWHKGRHLLVELKTPTGGLKPSQVKFFAELDLAGYPVWVIRSTKAFVELIERWIKGEV